MILSLAEIMDLSQVYPDRENFARAVIAAYEAKLNSAEPVAWEYRLHSGQWSNWERLLPRNPHTDTIEDRVAEIQSYIDNGFKYELRKLFAHPPAPSAVEWISVEDRLPDDETPVLIIFNGEIVIGPHHGVVEDVRMKVESQAAEIVRKQETIENCHELLGRKDREIARLSALCDKWNSECDDMREDNKRLAAECAKIEQQSALWQDDYNEMKALCDQIGEALDKHGCAYRGHEVQYYEALTAWRASK